MMFLSLEATTSKAYLEPFQTSMIELFGENGEQLNAVNYFLKKLLHRYLIGV